MKIYCVSENQTVDESDGVYTNKPNVKNLDSCVIKAMILRMVLLTQKKSLLMNLVLERELSNKIACL
jgi:hypothetical protein